MRRARGGAADDEIAFPGPRLPWEPVPDARRCAAAAVMTVLEVAVEEAMGAYAAPASHAIAAVVAQPPPTAADGLPLLRACMVYGASGSTQDSAAASAHLVATLR
jgi:hypothetical protein